MQPYCFHPTNQVCDSCSFASVLKTAREHDRQPTYNELTRVLNMAVARTDYDAISSVLNEFGYDILPQQTYEDMITARIMGGDYGLSCHAAEMAGRTLTQSECDSIAFNALYFSNDTRQVVRLIDLKKLSEEGMRKMIGVCLDRALPQIAGLLAKQIEHQFSAGEIDRLHTSCEEKGFPDRLRYVYELPTLVVA